MLAVELCKWGLELPPQVQFTLDTYWVVKSSASNHVPWKDVGSAAWPELTDTGQKRLTISCLATWVASCGLTDLSKTFETECGEAHEALADARGVVLLLKPGPHGIYPIVTKFKVLQYWSTYTNNAPGIVAKPVVVHEDPPEPWVESPMPPAGVVREPTLPGIEARRAGKPTAELLNHIKSMNNGQIPNDIEPLMVAIFTFFFTTVLVEHICKCTNAYATTMIDKGGAFRPRIKDWDVLYPGELYVIFGCLIIMGVHGYTKKSQAWSLDFGAALRDPNISGAIKRQLLYQRLANLTFDWRRSGLCSSSCSVCAATTGYEEYMDEDPLRKIRKVDTYLQQRCGMGLYRTCAFVIDESMLRIQSRFCKYLQHMPAKPIKYGLKPNPKPQTPNPKPRKKKLTEKFKINNS